MNEKLTEAAERAGYRLGGDLAGNYTLTLRNGATIGTCVPCTNEGAAHLLSHLTRSR